jgi:Fur family transcriptional regulator, ferric uptake regulator
VSADLHDSASDRLQRSEGRYTRKRRDLVELLIQAGQPLTVEELHDLAPHLAQSTLYRNLAILEETGVVRRFASNSGFARFELAEDLTGHHHHLVCDSCGAMTDVKLPQSVEQQLDDVIIRLARRRGFQAAAHTVDIHGRCASCTG